MLTLYFFFNDPATTEIYTLSLHDALPISNATVPVNEISFRIVMTNVSSKPVTLSGDNFATTLDGKIGRAHV